MAHASVSKTEESWHEKIKNQENCHYFFDSREAVHKEFVPPGVTVNHKYYPEVLDRLRKRVMRVRMLIADDWILGASSQQCALTHSIVSS
jgi:hypothetical protein